MDDNFSEYLDYRDIDESQSVSSKQQSIAPSTGSKRSSFIDLESSTGSQQQQKKLKSSKYEKSFVWKYFKKVGNDKVQCIVPIIKNEKEEQCNITYKYTGSTSNMKYHLNTAHNKTEGDKEKEIYGQQKVGQDILELLAIGWMKISSYMMYSLPLKSERLQEVQNELNKKNQSLAENSDDDEPLESFPTNILKNINEKKLKEKYDVEIDDLDNAEEINDNENMKEILTDDSDEDNSDLSENSDLDEANNEPIIIRSHKHNLHKKPKKINYSETSRKLQSTSEDTLEDSQPSQRESANPNQIIKRVLKTIIKSFNYYWKEPDQNALISTILDPRYKSLDFLSDDDLKIKTEVKLQNMYEDLKFELNPNEKLFEILLTIKENVNNI
ncbi:hypothetical protein C1646_677369 [Rhizophagus diaphanus]|nr:hypothetical protein C1646_677369 [Rhizophagus diaphanus] [Rhizophagus sp. MUCL 43196]